MVENGDTEEEPKEDYHTINDTANKAIITELAESCGDVDISTVIKCYQIGSTNKEIRKQLKQQLVPPLMKAATYLGLNTDGEAKHLKDTLITYIIRRIESLLKDLCGVCGDYYNNTLHDEPPFKCLICAQGCHKPCYEEMDAVFKGQPDTVRQAFQFICTKCFGDFSDDHSAVEKPKQSPVKTPVKEVEIVGEEETIAGIIYAEPSDHLETPPVREDTTIAEICPDYKWGRCPNYEECDFRHPPRCWNWLNTGKCSYKKKCKYHHPPLCNDSLRYWQCFNSECRYFHIAQTQRYKREDEQLKTALHPSAYMQQPQRHQPPQYQQVPAPQPTHHQQETTAPQPAYHHAHQASNPHQQHPSHPPQAQSSLNPTDMAFLLKSIRDIKDDLGKEIADIKQNLSVQVHNASRPQIITTANMPQTQTIPNQYMMPHLMMPVQHPAAHPPS